MLLYLNQTWSKVCVTLISLKSYLFIQNWLCNPYMLFFVYMLYMLFFVKDAKFQNSARVTNIRSWSHLTVIFFISYYVTLTSYCHFFINYYVILTSYCNFLSIIMLLWHLIVMFYLLLCYCDILLSFFIYYYVNVTSYCHFLSIIMLLWHLIVIFLSVMLPWHLPLFYQLCYFKISLSIFY